MTRPLLIVISAPSGAGKTTLGAMLRKEFRGMRRSVSGTTRARRKGEINRRDYFFMTPEEFRKKLNKGCFLETALVHGHWYGTPRAPVLNVLKKGRDILLVIDVQGAKRIRDYVKKEKDPALKAAFLDVFVLPPDMQELKRRLIKRGQNNPGEIRLRLKNADMEMRSWRDFRYVILNDSLAKAYEELRSIVIAEHCKPNPKSQVPNLK